MAYHHDPKSAKAVWDKYRDYIVNIQSNLETYGFPEKMLETQRQILARSLKLIEELQSGTLPVKEGLANFCDDLTPNLMKNVRWASEIQINGLHRQTQAWKKEIPSKDWNQLSVIVIGPQMPRVGEVSLQYFARVTGVSLKERQVLPTWLTPSNEIAKTPENQNRRLVYAENLWEEKDALDLLAVHIVDEQVGSMFFKNKDRTKIDVLARDAFNYLEKNCAKTWDCS